MKKGDAYQAPLGAVLEFTRLIWGLDHSLQKASKRMGVVLGLTGPQRFVLRILGCRPGLAAGALAEVLKLHPSTLSGVLKRLEARGLVMRLADPADARRRLLHLTPKGQSYDVPSTESIEAGVARALSGFDEHGLWNAASVLTALASSLTRSRSARAGSEACPLLHHDARRRGGRDGDAVCRTRRRQITPV